MYKIVWKMLWSSWWCCVVWSCCSCCCFLLLHYSSCSLVAATTNKKSLEKIHTCSQETSIFMFILLLSIVVAAIYEEYIVRSVLWYITHPSMLLPRNVLWATPDKSRSFMSLAFRLLSVRTNVYLIGGFINTYI